MGSVGDAYDNALAESQIGLYKAELIRPEGPWRGVEHVKLETLNWVDFLTTSAHTKPWTTSRQWQPKNFTTLQEISSSRPAEPSNPASGISGAVQGPAPNISKSESPSVDQG